MVNAGSIVTSSAFLMKRSQGPAGTRPDFEWGLGIIGVDFEFYPYSMFDVGRSMFVFSFVLMDGLKRSPYPL
jgi:hypothetical protein